MRYDEQKKWLYIKGEGMKGNQVGGVAPSVHKEISLNQNLKTFVNVLFDSRRQMSQKVLFYTFKN